jgi:hypothetical protein
MDKKLFGTLLESMQQHNEIIAGTRKAARATKVDAQSIRNYARNLTGVRNEPITARDKDKFLNIQ